MKHSPKFITSLSINEVFVFGSNEGGRHGAGAAAMAMKWGARIGVGNGRSGNTYAIPTKDRSIRNTLSLKKIGIYVDQFIDHASKRLIEEPTERFLVTEIGCGLAGYEPKDIAPLFKRALEVENILLPKRFVKLLNH